jgi:hypothetical protein
LLMGTTCEQNPNTHPQPMQTITRTQRFSSTKN